MALSGLLTRGTTLPDSSDKSDFHNLIDSSTVTISGTVGPTSTNLDLSAVDQKIVMSSKAINEAQGSDIASATTTDIGAATGNYVVVTGTTTITGLGTVQSGTRRIVKFSGVLTLTHNATSLILPNNGSNITTAAGDSATFVSLGSGNWICVDYQRASGSSVASSSSVPTNYRSSFYIMQASTTTITVAPGILEVNGSSISKTSNTTLTISTAGDWAGGSSLRATNTTAYVGVDSSGNIKMHTTAPSHADYALSITAANNTKRYASWSSTTYRIIGWFRMNGTGSGELDTYGVSNICDGAIKNFVKYSTGAVATGTTTIPEDDTIPQNTEGDQYMSLNFVPTNVNNKLTIKAIGFFGESSDAADTVVMALFQDSTANALCCASSHEISSANVGSPGQNVLEWEMKAGTTSLTTFKIRAGMNAAGTCVFNGATGGARRYGGSLASFISVEEEESQLT